MCQQPATFAFNGQIRDGDLRAVIPAESNRGLLEQGL